MTAEPFTPQRLALRVLSSLTSPAALRVVRGVIGGPWRSAQIERRPLAEYKRVLVVRPDEIGDMVLMSAFLRELRANLPDAWITLVVKTGASGLVRHCPHVNEVIVYQWEGSLSWGLIRRMSSVVMLVRSKLLPRQFELAIVPRWNTDYYGASQLAYLSGAPRRVAYSERVSRPKARFNPGYDRLFTDLLTDDSPKHEVEKNLNVIRFLGGTVKSDTLEVWTTQDDAASARAMLDAEGLSGNERLVVLGVGAREAEKTWPAANFLSIARWLHEERKARVIVVGDEADAKTGQALANALGPAVANLVGRTNLGQLTEILKRSDLFIGNDSGPKHIAAAVGVPVVEISWHARSGNDTDGYSPTEFGPWRTPSQILQPEDPLPPCTDACRAGVAHCITQVGVETVKEAAAAFLDLRGENAEARS